MSVHVVCMRMCYIVINTQRILCCAFDILTTVINTANKSLRYWCVLHLVTQYHTIVNFHSKSCDPVHLAADSSLSLDRSSSVQHIYSIMA